MSSPKTRIGRLLPLATLASAAFLGGCGGYNSDYAPLADGRARPVYRDDKLVMEVGGGVTQACANALADPRSPETGSYIASRSHAAIWIPVYYGPQLVVVQAGLAPTPSRPRYTGESGPTFSGLSFPGRTAGGGSPGGGSGGSSGGGGLGDLKEGFVIVAVIAIVAMPAITIGLAIGRPEPEKEVAEVIDRVNVYNDLARTPGSPCPVYSTQAPGSAAP